MSEKEASKDKEGSMTRPCEALDELGDIHNIVAGTDRRIRAIRRENEE